MMPLPHTLELLELTLPFLLNLGYRRLLDLLSKVLFEEEG
jgi:hypothetical protein